MSCRLHPWPGECFRVWHLKVQVKLFSHRMDDLWQDMMPDALPCWVSNMHCLHHEKSLENLAKIHCPHTNNHKSVKVLAGKKCSDERTWQETVCFCPFLPTGFRVVQSLPIPFAKHKWGEGPFICEVSIIGRFPPLTSFGNRNLRHVAQVEGVVWTGRCW